MAQTRKISSITVKEEELFETLHYCDPAEWQKHSDFDDESLAMRATLYKR